jgi:hypothetical protein
MSDMGGCFDGGNCDEGQAVRFLSHSCEFAQIKDRNGTPKRINPDRRAVFGKA